MSTPGKVLLCLLIALAGCQTPPPEKPAPARPPAPNPVQPPRTNPPALKPAPILTPRLAASTNIARPQPGYVETWVSLGRWARENRAGTLRQIISAVSPTFALVTSNGVMMVQANSRVAQWDGLEVHLGFEPQIINDQLFMHVLDLKKNLEPLLRATARPAKPGRVVVLDPGHGGPATGTTSVLDGEYEKEFTLDWALRIAPLLATNGWQVFLTRTDDVDVALSNRVAFAEQRKADLFISLHFNSAAPSREQSGVETYCLTPAGMPSTLIRNQEDDLSLVFPNNAFDTENLQYAHRLQRALLQVADKDRGLRHARFLGVLRGQNRPAVLLEGGYLSNPQEAENIADPEYRQQLAEAVAAALGPGAGFRALAAGKPTAGNGTNGNSATSAPATNRAPPATTNAASTAPVNVTNTTPAASANGTNAGSATPRTNSAPLR